MIEEQHIRFREGMRSAEDFETRPEFRGDIDMSRYTGNQKWLIWCLEQFLNSIDE